VATTEGKNTEKMEKAVLQIREQHMEGKYKLVAIQFYNQDQMALCFSRTPTQGDKEEFSFGVIDLSQASFGSFSSSTQGVLFLRYFCLFIIVFPQM